MTVVRLYKLLALASFILLTGALAIIVLTGPATGYEISIYRAYPPCFWGFLILSLVMGMAILVLQAFSQHKSNWWLAGVAVVIMSDVILYLLPLFRGYAFVDFMDTVMQAGYIKDILLTGHFGTRFTGGENYYPATHVMASAISLISALSIETVMKLIPPLFYPLFVVFMYLLAGELAERRGQQLLITALAGVPLFVAPTDTSYPPCFVPRLLVLMLLPLILYLFYRSQKTSCHRSQYTLMLVLILLAAPFWHPTNGGLFLFGILLVVGIALWLQKKFTSTGSLATSPLRPSDSINPALIVVVVWLVWFSTTWTFAHYIRSFKDALVFEMGKTETEIYLGWLSRTGMGLSDTIITFLKKQGYQLPYLAAAGIISLIIWGRMIFVRRQVTPSLAVFSLLFLAFALAVPLETFSHLQLTSGRFLLYAVLLSTVVVGLGLYQFCQRFRRKTTAVAIVLTIMGLTAIQGVLVAYPSPATLGANAQVTITDTKGITWLVEHQDDRILVAQVVMNPYNLAAASLGAQRIPKNFRLWMDSEAPTHFGYDRNDTFGASYETDRYYLSHEMARVYYTKRLQKYPNAWRWTPEDFARLETDPTVSRIYDSGGFEVFDVRGEQSHD